jgi:2,3-bisphosphoglycerate-independent phosphoglycerate mutase
MRVLFIFMDGIGLGDDDPRKNPFARADMPALQALLGGRRLIAASAPFVGERASLLALDAGLGVPGLPQSATGQSVLLTGVNIPARIGEHYGPKPNPAVASCLHEGTLFSQLTEAGRSAALLNAYPPRYFEGVDSGKRLYSAIPLAVTSAGLPLFTRDDYYAGRALAADFTGRGWQEHLSFSDAPVLEPRAAGRKLAELANHYDFSLFEYWASDYAGHRQDMPWAVEQLEVFDGVLAGLLEAWEDTQGLILITSDHGNMEDLSTRRHTDAKVPLLLFGGRAAREQFGQGAVDLTAIQPGILRLIL